MDDEDSVRYTFESIMAHEGYEVSVAKDYDEAVRMIDESDFDLVLTDIMLGEETGVDVLRAVRERRKNCPVVMITGYPNLDTAEDSLRLGAFDYLRKPVTFENLMSVSNKALAHKRTADAKERRRATTEAILRSVSDAFVAVDADLRILDINESSRNICGFPGNVLGGRFETLVRSCSGRCVGFLKKVIAGKSAGGNSVIECNRKGRPDQTVRLTAYPLRRSQDASGGGVLIIRDETRPSEILEEETERHQFCALVGKSSVMRKIYSLIEALADVQTTVLITGESGTGKELVASALHSSGNRAGKPIVKVNCAALSDSLLESELFGHVKGAFTGAVRDKVGRFQRADGGTIFLDEVGDISVSMQMRLLRVLQEREFEKVGDSSPIRVDVRVVVATNSNLAARVSSGAFREDLYYRLKVVEISLPPLRDRMEDIPLLVERFIRKFNAKFRKEIESVSEDVMKIFGGYRWPGNVRELEHKLEHAFVHCKGTTITVHDLPVDLRDPGLAGPGPSGVTAGDERSVILHALEKTFWNKTKAAGLLGMSRRTIYRKIKDYHIKDGR